MRTDVCTGTGRGNGSVIAVIRGHTNYVFNSERLAFDSKGLAILFLGHSLALLRIIKKVF